MSNNRVRRSVPLDGPDVNLSLDLSHIKKLFLTQRATAYAGPLSGLLNDDEVRMLAVYEDFRVR